MINVSVQIEGRAEGVSFFVAPLKYEDRFLPIYALIGMYIATIMVWIVNAV
ncbi:hypothetical protein IB238_00220 [Rhizobium sp. ARZ01]|uniref:hypothetical protein n=1 Tax=Rhizobium sp. ARZ01 TaxID=2769313 RepID=UPI00177AFA1F|nr:hypothetical protein [Rhizobium sp. ARZ01]MBD9371061.1 hypothetical protein [Rhizobium sp. ARZ01]